MADFFICVQDLLHMTCCTNQHVSFLEAEEFVLKAMYLLSVFVHQSWTVYDSGLVTVATVPEIFMLLVTLALGTALGKLRLKNPLTL